MTLTNDHIKNIVFNLLFCLSLLCFPFFKGYSRLRLSFPVQIEEKSTIESKTVMAILGEHFNF